MIRLIIWCRSFSNYLLAAWIIAIIFVSSIPSIPTLKIQTANSEIRLDYLIHFIEYSLLAFFAFLSFSGNKFNMSYRKFILITLALVVFAIIDEVHQKIIPGRAFNIKDLLCNISGIVAALFFCMAAFRIIKIRINNS